MKKLISFLLVIFMMAAPLSACAQSNAPVMPSINAQASNQCLTEFQIQDALQNSIADSYLDDGEVFSIPNANAMRILSAFELDGYCAEHFPGLNHTGFFLRDDPTAPIGAENGGRTRLDIAPMRIDGSNFAQWGALVPRLQGEFQSAVRMEFLRLHYYAGIWRSNSLSNVYFYSVNENGSFSPAKLLLTSKYPVTDFSYVPGLHGSSGMFYVGVKTRGKRRFYLIAWTRTTNPA